MKKNRNIRKAVNASLVFLVSASHVASAMDLTKKQGPSLGSSNQGRRKDLSEPLRNHEYYKKELQKLEESTARIHKEVDRILREFRRNMEDYYKRTKTGATMTTVPHTPIPKYSEEELRNDPLKNYNYSRLNVPLHSTVKGLEIRKKPLNTSGGLQKSYTIEGRTFKRQNVSGGRLDCLFNSVGLTRQEAVEKLIANRNDPIVRYMIANETVSAIADPNQLPAALKTAINYKLYTKETNDLNTLREQQGSLLLKQNKDPNLQDTHLLPPNLQKAALDKQERTIVENLRTRATSLESFYALVYYYIGQGNQMATIPDTTGEVGDNPYSNYTSIDAIAYINNFGIRIYNPVYGCKLYLLPKETPVNAAYTPALRKIGDNQYQLFVRTGPNSVSTPLDPAKLGIDVTELTILWDKKIWNVNIDYQTQYLEYTNKIMENIIIKGNHKLLEENILHLTHQFIPAKAKEIAYLYYTGNYNLGHYQALIPQQD